MPTNNSVHYPGKPGTTLYAGMPTPPGPPVFSLVAGMLELGKRVEDGFIVEAVSVPWLKLLELLKRSPEEIYRIPPRELEELIAAAYVEAGFEEVILTPRSGDLGRDVIATKFGFGSIRIFDQAKAYKPDHLVTAEEVRAMAGILQGNVSKGIVSTSSDFAPRIREDRILKDLMPHRLELKNGRDLTGWFQQITDKK